MKQIMSVWYSKYADLEWQVFYDDGTNERVEFPTDDMIAFVSNAAHWKRDGKMCCWFKK